MRVQHSNFLQEGLRHAGATCVCFAGVWQSQ
nr:MAG TPA: hypothetical protein [Caudoviricetes sp.]